MLSALLPKAPINPTDSFHLYPCLFIVLPRDQSRVFHTGVATLSYEFKRNLDASAHPCRDRQAHSVTPDHCFYENSFLFFSFVLPLSSCAFLALAHSAVLFGRFQLCEQAPLLALAPSGQPLFVPRLDLTAPPGTYIPPSRWCLPQAGRVFLIIKSDLCAAVAVVSSIFSPSLACFVLVLPSKSRHVRECLISALIGEVLRERCSDNTVYLHVVVGACGVVAT